MTPSAKSLAGLLTLLLCTAFLAVAAEDPTAATAAKAWSQVPEILKRIVPPHFPDRNFDITHYGATGDGVADCTGAFKSAIEACHQAGGGHVVVPQGKFLTGAIHLDSNVDLHIVKGATILFSTNTAMFLPVVFSRDVAEMMNYSPFIYAFEKENVAVTGEGTINGQARVGVWQSWAKQAGKDGARLTEMGDKHVPVSERVFGEGHLIRPNFVEPVRCRNVLIEGITITNSPMWVIHPLYCTNVTVRGVTVGTEGPNTDGCDPDSCTDVLIKNCSFSDGDDCIAVKAGRDHDGRRINIPSQNVVIQGCKFKKGHGGITMGSETAGGLRNIFAENCELDSPDLDNALRFKTNPARGGFIENIYIRNCTVKTAKVGIHMTMRYSSSGLSQGESIPQVHDIDIRDCSFGTLSKQPIFIEGWSPEAQITDVTIANCTFGNAKGGNTVTNAARVSINGNQIN